MSAPPEEVREQVRQEELAKGSDPRVVEARAKAAEARARHGLPVDPQQAWRQKLQQAGREPAPETSAPAPAAEEEPAPPAAEAPAEQAPAPPAEAPAQVAAAAVPAQAAPAPAPAAPPEPETFPEVGEVYEREEFETREVAGVRVRTVAISKWMVALMTALALWAIMYLIVLSGGNVVRETTGCVVARNGTFTCFHPKTDAEGGAEGGH